MTGPRLRLLAALCCPAALMVTACGFNGLASVPLPGGADLGAQPYTVRIDFTNVLDLVPQSPVKVNDVTVGKVDAINLVGGWTAEVTATVNGSVRLPANATASVRQSSLLGAKYVELASPVDQPPQGTLVDGAVITTNRTSRGTQVEEILGALSMLLNDGGVQQVQTIAREADAALAGNESQIRSFLSEVDQTVGNLDGQRGNIVRALDGINQLSATLVRQKTNIGSALDNLAPGLRVLDQQRQQLVGMLQALDNLSHVVVDTISKSGADLVADLRALNPTLQQLGAAGRALPGSLQILATFPFTDYALQDIGGDYLNADMNVDLNLNDVLSNLGNDAQAVLPQPSTATGSSGGIPLPLPATPNLPPPTGPQTGSGNGLAGLLNSLLGGGGH